MNLVFENISKVFQETVALEKIDLTMSSGVYGLLGPNGAGKTTIMKIMTDLVSPSTGRVLLDGSEENASGGFPAASCCYGIYLWIKNDTTGGDYPVGTDGFS